MGTPFDEAIEDIIRRKYHNQRQQFHSDIVSEGILRDLLHTCNELRRDLESSEVKSWFNVPAPGGRSRHIDLMIGEPTPEGKPNLNRIRICVENKSVMTAHRNKHARYDDLSELVKVLQEVRPETIVVCTVMIGVANRFLNVADRVTPFYKSRMAEFERKILPRLSSGDQSLWTEFGAAVSTNKAHEPNSTKERFLKLPTRSLGRIDKIGFDFLLLVPVFINNVDPPYIARSNDLGIDVNKEYNEMLVRVCKGYNTNWHR